MTRSKLESKIHFSLLSMCEELKVARLWLPELAQSKTSQAVPIDGLAEAAPIAEAPHFYLFRVIHVYSNFFPSSPIMCFVH